MTQPRRTMQAQGPRRPANLGKKIAAPRLFKIDDYAILALRNSLHVDR